MRLKQAIDMLAPGMVGTDGPTTWADLGCGRGTFTLALAHLLPPRSTIHAMDRDVRALEGLPARHDGVSIHAWHGDFLDERWPFSDLDGILMANSLHYAPDQLSLVRRCATLMKPVHRFLIVEYDTSQCNRWVPYPVGVEALEKLFATAGYPSIAIVGSRRSIYHEAHLYAALVRP